MTIANNIINVKQHIQHVCQKVGRDPNEITLVAVSKTFSAEIIKTAVENGIEHVGENRVQEAEGKFEQLGKIATWHLVGHLQTNKVKKRSKFLILFIRWIVFILPRKLVNELSNLDNKSNAWLRSIHLKKKQNSV